MILLEINTWLEPTCDIATIIIAVVNIFWVIYVFRKNSQRDKLKSLVLDYNIKYLYEFYENVLSNTEGIKKATAITQKLKEDTDKKIQEQAKILEQKFIDLFLSVNRDLHKELKNQIDDLTGKISESLFDPGINLNVSQMYDEKIANIISLSKSKIIKLLLTEC